MAHDAPDRRAIKEADIVALVRAARGITDAVYDEMQPLQAALAPFRGIGEGAP